MLIAIEGPDGSGKSTLIENLRKSLKGNVLYLSRSGRFTDVGQIVRSVYEIVKLGYSESFDHIILDRHPMISEWVYGWIFRDGGLLNGWTLDELRFGVNEFTLIYCDTELYTLRRSAHAKDQMAGVLNRLPEIHQMYRDVMHTLEPRFQYDFECTGRNGSMMSDFEHIIEILNNGK